MREPRKLMLIPAAGKRVKDPLTLKVLDVAGEQKPESSYWIRRLAEGDVVEVKADAPPIVEAKTERKTKNKPAPLALEKE